MKKNLLLLWCFSMAFSIISCTNETNSSTSEKIDLVEKDSNSSSEEIDLDEKENRELYITMPSNRNLKVAQFADIHFGIEGNNWHNDKVERTKKYMQSIVDNQHPDLIVCSGDNILTTGIDGVNEFIELMESYKTPWIWIYGNHDAESFLDNFKKSDISHALLERDTKYLLYKEGYIEEGLENRYGNFSVTIYDELKENILGVLIILDAGTYNYSTSKYQTITTGQIIWYKEEIDTLQEKYQKQSNNIYEVIPSIVFSHIQLPEHFVAYNKALLKDGAEFIIEQKLSNSSIKENENDSYVENSPFFETLVERKSTKAYLVGHAHTLYFQVKYQDIILGFAPQTGFSKLYENNDDPRKTYIYNIKSDLTFTTDCINEVI